jgi:hypothetical protein
VDFVHVQPAGQRASVGQAADPAAREGGAGEVVSEATGGLAQLVVGGHQDRLRDRKPQLGDQSLECALVVETGQHGKRGCEDLGEAAQPLDLGRDVEGLFEGRHDHVDLVLCGDPLELGEEGRRVAARRGVDEVARQVLRVVPR